MNMKLLTIELYNISKKYSRNVVFNNFHLLINNEKVNFLISPNGKGKSTLIKIMLRIISFNGNVFTNCKTFSYCPEKVILPDYVKVIDFLNLFNLDINDALVLLDKFKVDPKLKIKSLSKGMHQKIIIIQCLTTNVDAYFFDEPLNGLDYESENIFIEEIQKLQKKGKMIVIASHYLERYKTLLCNVVELKKYD